MEKNIETEKCVSCGIDTKIPVSLNVEVRSYYVEGAGQLCRDCYKKTFDKQEKK
jgi:NMD protein affecting ribosome stability and mRNA decay